MAIVTVDDEALRITLTVPERVLSLQAADVRVLRREITSARVVQDALAHVRGARRPGARVPGVSAVGVWEGTVERRPFRDFVIVDRPGPGVVIETVGAFDRILVGRPDADAFAEQLRGGLVRACGGRPPTG